MTDNVPIREFKWVSIAKKELSKMKEYHSLLVACDSEEFPYDIIEYGKFEDKEFWHSLLHDNNDGGYEYSSNDVISTFTHYFPLSHPKYGFNKMME